MSRPVSADLPADSEAVGVSPSNGELSSSAARSAGNADVGSPIPRVLTCERHPSAASHKSEAIPSLDGIRAISVMIVVLAHCGYEIVPGGFGVTIFFFLSGYLISTLLIAEHARTGTISIGLFYLRRAFRLMPPLLVMLAVAYSATAIGLLHGGVSLKGFAAQLLYFANYYGLFFDPGNTIPEGTGILWSLAVEEHFYLAYPLALSWLLGRNLGPRELGTVLALVCIAVLLWRFHLATAATFHSDRTYYASDSRIDSIVYGCLLAILYNPVSRQPRDPAMTVADWALIALSGGALLVSFTLRNPLFRETIRYSIQGVALMPLFYYAIAHARAWPFRWLGAGWLMRLGTYSYSIYLIHYVIIKMLVTNSPAIANRPAIILPLTLSLSIIFAWAVDRYVDSYFRGLRKRFRPAGD